MSERPAVPRAVIRPLVEPIPVYPWAIVHRAGARFPELEALQAVIAELSEQEGWDQLPEGAWLPSTDVGWSQRLPRE